MTSSPAVSCSELPLYRAGFFVSRPTRYRPRSNARVWPIVNLLQLQPEETVSSVINISKTDNAGQSASCVPFGRGQETPFEQLYNVRTSGLIALIWTTATN